MGKKTLSGSPLGENRKKPLLMPEDRGEWQGESEMTETQQEPKQPLVTTEA